MAAASGTLMGPALREAKRTVRARIIALRDALDPAFRQSASVAIAGRLAALASFRSAECVLLTLPYLSEWNTRPLLEAARSDGKTIVLPRVDGTTKMLALHRVDDIDGGVTIGFRGIPEPRADLPVVDIGNVDWVLVPGLAFDRSGGRLGYGGGYYDRLFVDLAAEAARIAGAFAMQLVDNVPAAPHDLVVDAIATEDELLLIDRVT